MVPDGLLVFFPSYPVLKACQEAWQLSGLWDAINQVKTIFVEPTSKDGFLAVMSGFYSAVADENRRGACFMAVCRGKVSEGLDFCDTNGRAVIITGLPFPPSRDPRVLEKQKYLEDNRKDPRFKGLTGQQWYRLEATRAVNQAIGRVIRHRLDYGAILLCDQRFSSPDLIQQLSAWVRPRVQTFSKFGPLPRDLGQFFRNADVNFPCTQRKPKIKIEYETSSVESRKVLSSVDSSSHALSSGSSRPAGSSSRNPSSKADKSEVDLFQYSTGSKPRDERKSLSHLFDGTDQQKKMIDFNDIEASKSPGTPDLDLKSSGESSASQPAVKKRKLTIVSNAQKAKIDMERNLAKVAASSSAVDKKQNASDYLKKVRESLDSSRYQMFSSVIKSYKQDKNFESLVQSLKDLFIQPSFMPDLFTGTFHTFHFVCFVFFSMFLFILNSSPSHYLLLRLCWCFSFLLISPRRTQNIFIKCPRIVFVKKFDTFIRFLRY